MLAIDRRGHVNLGFSEQLLVSNKHDVKEWADCNSYYVVMNCENTGD